MFYLSKKPLEKLKLSDDFSRGQAGAFCCFEGWVRDQNEGKPVRFLEYEAHESLCRREAEKILEEAQAKFHVIQLKAAHRTGKLKIGEMAVWAGATAAHRENSFQACRYIIDEIKKRLPIWKKEHYADGQCDWVNCGNDFCIDLSSLPKGDWKRYTFIDIRETNERVTDPAGEIESLHLPLSQFPSNGFRFDPSRQYVLFCAKGMRSFNLTKKLREEGVTNTFSLKDGISAIKTYFHTHAAKN